jgi:hypothetical protein
MMCFDIPKRGVEWGGVSSSGIGGFYSVYTCHGESSSCGYRCDSEKTTAANDDSGIADRS